MGFVSKYVSHIPNEEGFVEYSTKEHEVWQTLFARQQNILPHRACDEFLRGLKRLAFTKDYIPQLPQVTERLKALTGWEVVPVAALISPREFFQLLAARQFPAATFIRSKDELDYVTEPDIFHELFGHCPMLTEPVYAEFMCEYGRKVLTLPESDWPLLQRLFWFTVEFGLIKTKKGLRAYGGGILSSISETPYSVESELALRALFDPLAVFRTPYRIDCRQPVYFVIDDFSVLYGLIHSDLQALMQQARSLGEYPPFFTMEPNNPNIHILAC